MDPALEELVGTLLYEGYALYPYTPGATKNATPTPFGIVYPPAYAQAHARAPSTSCACRASRVPTAMRCSTGEVRFLQGAGERHQAVPRRLEAPGRTLAELAPSRTSSPSSTAALHGRVRMSADDLGDGRWRVMLCVHNTTPVAEGLDRAGALAASLLSTHPRPADRRRALRLAAGRRDGRRDERQHLPGARDRADDALLGAAIVLPDHPQLAPESRGDLFDGTEIEEALLLHVHALSDDERAAIAAAGPGRARDDRARRAATPEDLLALHGRTTLVRSGAARTPSRRGEERGRGRRRHRPPAATRSCCASATQRPLRPDPRRPHGDDRAHLLRLRRQLYFGVTVDDDPGQELMRETGRYLFFFADEVEVCAT